MDKPIKGISQGLSEACEHDAHIIKNAKDHIKFINASSGYEFMVGQTLLQEQGITFELLKKDEKGADHDQEGKDNKIQVVSQEGKPSYIVVPEVVRENRIHYYRVPKLGSYLAIKLEYKSCLFEQAFEAALDNYAVVTEKIREQELEKAEWEAH